MFSTKAMVMLPIMMSFLAVIIRTSHGQEGRRHLGKLEEVFSWTQLTYNINGNSVLRDRFGNEDLDAEEEEDARRKRQTDRVFFNDREKLNDRDWEKRPPRQGYTTPAAAATPASTNSYTNESGRFFIQYNNVPMGLERYKDRLFITVPRRRYGIPATLNYIDLSRDSKVRSPSLRPYPNLRLSRALTSVYRTRVDSCNRLWVVDTGLLEIPDAPQQLQQPAIVVYDLKRHRQMFRYTLKSSDLPQPNTPTGLASITVDIQGGDCDGAYAYIPDLTTYGIIVYSLKDNDSWRVTNNYFHFNPLYGNLNVAGQNFQWNDGIFSIALSSANSRGCKTAYFHPMASHEEFSVSTCVLKNRTASSASNYWENYSIVGERGDNSQCTMHGYHAGTKVVFFAEIGRNSVSCWNSAAPLTPSNVVVLAQDSQRLAYPADLHVTGDEIWILVNTLPRFIYSRLDTESYNFYAYRAKVRDLIAGTRCDNAGTKITFN